MSLEIVIGPMYSGKTTSLISAYQAIADVNKIIIDFDLSEKNTNYVSHGSMESHGGLIVPNVYKCKKLSYLLKKQHYKMKAQGVVDYFYQMFTESKYIFINECQFFPDLKMHVLELLMAENKHVYLYGLDGDFKQEIMGQTFDLIPYCNKIKKKTGKCKHCDNKSIISHRTHTSREVYLADPDCYIPLCLSCYGDIKNEI